MKRKILKQRARERLKKNYAIFVFACFFAAVLGVQFANSLGVTKINSTIREFESGRILEENSESVKENVNQNMITSASASTGNNFVSILDYLFEDSGSLVYKSLYGKNGEAEKEIAKSIEENKKNETAIIGKSRGVLAGMFNTISSGSIVVKMSRGLQNIFKDKNTIMGIMIIIAMIIQFSIWFFIKNTYHVVYRRVMLEGSTYDKIPFNRFTFLLRVKKWCRTSWIMFVKWLFQTLWSLTIIGGIIKHYSYKMVPYIIAENPNMKARDAINLSRRMMKDQKWECFKLDCSFIGWWLLNSITFGLSGIFYSNPYKIATYCQFYKGARILAKNEPIIGAELLNDQYLFEKADASLLIEPYKDIIQAIRTPDEDCSYRGILGILANWFGIVLFYSSRVRKFEEQQAKHLRIDQYQRMLAGTAYPTRLYPISVKEKNLRVVHLNYLRQYSICSLILMFFIFSFVGWLWEVSLHLVSDGVFVNRGVMHGPWLPIYGAGCVMILIILYRLRKKPVIELISIIVLCGMVEYFTSYFLEISHNGMKWWDYSGYLLNLNGRICAEGLVVFAIGGMAVTYAVAPILDNMIRKVKLQILIPICAALLAIFTFDKIYSSKHPNSGAGITDYSYETPEEIHLSGNQMEARL